MQRLCFATFLVDDVNRRAAAACHEAAQRAVPTPQPVVLVAGPGSGKTHLLYAIVNEVRASGARVAMAYITANDFPDAVRALDRNPVPVEQAPAAILLVDQLERFREQDLDALEAVVRVFLESGHCVVFGSRVAIDQLPALPDGLKALLDKGQTLSFGPLKHAAPSVQPKTKTDADVTDGLKAAHEEAASLQEALAVVRAQADAARSQCEEARQTLDAAQQELARSRAIRDEALEEVEGLRMNLITARGKIDALKAECESLREEGAATDDLSARLKEAETALVTVRDERDKARIEADRLVRRAETLLAIVSHNRQYAAELSEAQRRQLAELSGELETTSPAGKDPLQTVRAEFEVERGALQEALRLTQERLEEVIDEAEEGRERVEAELCALQERFDAQAVEMDALRNEAATQVASANAKAGEAEGRLARMNGGTEEPKGNGATPSYEFVPLSECLGDSRDVVSRLARELAPDAAPANKGTETVDAPNPFEEVDADPVIPDEPADVEVPPIDDEPGGAQGERA